MRQVDKKYFGDIQSGRLNADDSPFAITTNEWVNAENVRSGTTDKGFTGIVESIGGNVELPRPLPFNTLDSVVIGTQTWTSKNLDVSTFANGETITQATSTEEWNSLFVSETPAWAYWNYDEANASLGKYYNTFAINSLKGLAPKGWHIPSNIEVQKLYDFVFIDHPQTAYALREIGTTHWQSADGTDNYGFSMQGNSALESSVYDIKYYGFFATSDNNVAKFSYSYPDVIIDSLEGFWGLNIRLVRDKEYTEVKIGEQIWIGENYEGIRYRNGELIPEVTDPTTWASLTTGAWCWYNNDEATYGQYGKLYNSYAINDPRGFAPEGYSVPTDSGVFDVESTTDFAILSNYLGGYNVSGAKLKEAGTAHWISPNTGSTNSSGFTALPGSERGDTGGFPVGFPFGIGQQCILGSSNKNYPSNYNGRRIINGYDSFEKSSVYSTEGVSVRLLKNQYITIGSVEDTENNRILYFNYDTSPNRIDKITCLYTDTNTQYDVLYGSQISSNIVTDIVYAESYTTTTNIAGILNTIQFYDSEILPYLQVGYKIRINNTVMAGDYIISAVNISNLAVTIYGFVNGIILFPTSANITIFNAKSIYKSNALNFNKNSLIHSAKMSGNILSWVEGTANEPRKINIESAIKANYINFETDAAPYIFPLDFSQITMIKRPPAFTPNFVKSYDSTFSNNFIRNDSFEFAFQYEYYDSEVSVVGSYSQASRANFPTDTYNCINVSMDFREFIPSTVKIINLIARKGNGNPTGSDYAFIINSWDRSIELQNQQIENQNNNAGDFLSFTFYYDAIGAVIAVDDVIRPYDLVPLYSQTHEIAKSRYFLANNTLGYDTPKTTSLSVELGGEITLSENNQTFPVYIIRCGATDGWYTYFWTYAGYFIHITTGEYTPGWYFINGTDQTILNGGPAQPHSLPSTPTAITNLVNRGATLGQVFAASVPSNAPTPSPTQGYYPFINSYTTTSTINITGLSTSYYNVLTQQSNYKLGIVFYDYAMRKCGVCAVNNSIQNIETNMYRIDSRTFGIPVERSAPFKSRQKITVSGLPDGNGEYTVISLGFATVSMTNLRTIIVGEDIASFADASVGTISYILSDIQLSTPTRNYAYSTANSSGIWYLSESNRLDEIPEWACYYSIVKTLNLRTRLFFESFSNSLKYVTRNSDGTFAYSSTYQTNQTYAIGINTDALVFSGLGYTFTEGDQCILWNQNGSIYSLQVIGQDGNYIFITPSDIGSFNSSPKFIYEIYTPYKENDSEPYYEFGEIYQIINPGSEYRTYEQLFGIIAPDSYAFTRNFGANTYFANAMSPNDIYWQRWDSDAGKVNVITRLGQSVNSTNIAWSDTYITGTQLNGSSTFRFGNDTYVPDDCGSINKLQLTSKVQDQGSVMLSLCSVETNSMYLGETQITDSTGAVQFFSGAQNVISTINTMKGNYGCIDPASVVQYRGNVYFLDASNGRWVQYSANGLDNISSVKMSRFWKNWCLKYLSMGKSEIEAFGDRPFVFATVDPSHDELLVSIPKLSNTPPQGYLLDYPEMVYPFDILDYEGKTLVYKLGTGAVVQPHWQGAYTFTVENFITLQNRLFTFKNGLVYEHNQPTNIVDQNTFFGDYFPSKIMFTSNILPQLPKVYDNFVSESNLVPNFVYFYNNYPKLQMSDLDNTSFVNLEGVWYAVILRNKRVDTGTSYTYDGLLTAEVMRNTNMYVLTEFSPTTEILQLRLLQLGTTISKGHTI